MNRAWVDDKIQKFEQEVQAIREEVIREITNKAELDEDDRQKLLKALQTENWTYEQMVKFNMLDLCGFHCLWDNDDLSYEELIEDPRYKAFCSWTCNIKDKAQTIYDYWQYGRGSGIYERYLDSEPHPFEGDIIITDPCYIVKPLDRSTEPQCKDFFTHDRVEEYDDYDSKTKKSAQYEKEVKAYRDSLDKWDEENERDWVVCGCGRDMSALGLKTWMTRDTLYGDWSCHTFNIDTKEPIGEFCADAGQVGVFLLDEVLQYNPNYRDHIEKDWTVTLIKDFKGTVQFIVNEHKGIWEDDSEYHKKGDTWVDYEVQVVGEGINTITNEPIRFITTQTGL